MTEVDAGMCLPLRSSQFPFHIQFSSGYTCQSSLLKRPLLIHHSSAWRRTEAVDCTPACVCLSSLICVSLMCQNIMLQMDYIVAKELCALQEIITTEQIEVVKFPSL